MKLAAAFALAIALAGLGAAQAQSSRGGIGDSGIFQTKLANGLKVIVVEDHAAPVAHTAMWYRFGSLDETPGKTGLAHALEHMMFRGTDSISAGGLDDIVARLGAEMNGQTDYDYTQYVFDMPADRVSVALQIEASRMQRAALLPQEWAVERRAVLNELDGDDSSPFYNLLSRVRAAAYPGLPAGRTPAGLRADVAKASAADIRRYYQEWYAPGNAALVVAGDVHHAAIFALANKYFGHIPAHPVPAHAAVRPRAAQGQSVEAEFPFPFEVVDLAYAVPGDTEPGEPAISTLASLIPNERGPFYQALVESNIALDLSANADTQLRGGLLHVFIIMNGGHNAAEAEQVFQSVMDHVLQNGFTPELVGAAKRATIADRTFTADSIGGYGDMAGYTYGIVGERNRDEDARLAALTPADLLAVAKTYLSKPTVVGHLTPNEKPAARTSQKTDAANSDNFNGRTPSGPILEPAAIRAALAQPSTARSKLAPVRFTLDNGLTVIVQEKHDRPTIYVRGEIDSSPAFAPAGQEGIGRLASVMAPFGSEHYDFTQLRKVTDDIGASVDLGQSFSAQGYAQDFETLLGVLADGEEHPVFPEHWLSLQRGQLANTVQMEENVSGTMVTHAYLQNLLAPGDPSLRFASPLSVASITRGDLIAFAQKYWRPDLTTIAIVGDVTPARARKAVEAAFGSWTNTGPKPAVTLPAIPPAHSGHDYIGTDANQVFIQLGQPAVARTNSDYDTFALLSEIIGGSGYFESRLWQELRQKRGLVYSVSSELKSDKDRGDLEIDLSASPANVAPSIALVREQLGRLRTQPISDSELASAKLRLISSALLSEASARGQLSEILSLAQDDLPGNYFATLQERYANITPSDIQRVARKYLQPDQLIQIYAGPMGPWAEHAI
jgi:zinc protease